MADDVTRVFVGGQQVTCPFCRYDRFRRRPIKLNTTGMSLMGLDWANKAAEGLICGHCGHVQMFVEPQIQYAD